MRRYLFLLFALAFMACKKDGTLIKANGFGTIGINATLDSGMLLVEVDGLVEDTLKAPADGAFKRTMNGSRQLKLYRPGQAAHPIVDTTLTVQGDTAFLKLLLVGNTAIPAPEPPADLKPAPGHSLVQFLNMDNALPDLIDIKVYELYFDDNGTFFEDPVTTLKGITKTNFSAYIDLPTPTHGDYSLFYYFDVYNSATGEQLLDAINDGPFVQLERDGFSFRPGKIVSTGIGKDVTGYTMATLIFEKTF